MAVQIYDYSRMNIDSIKQLYNCLAYTLMMTDEAVLSKHLVNKAHCHGFTKVERAMHDHGKKVQG